MSALSESNFRSPLDIPQIYTSNSEISPDSSSDVCSGKVVRTVPLPSAAKRSGPILMYPPNPIIQGILSPVGTPIVCQTEAEMKPLISITGDLNTRRCIWK